MAGGAGDQLQGLLREAIAADRRSDPEPGWRRDDSRERRDAIRQGGVDGFAIQGGAIADGTVPKGGAAREGEGDVRWRRARETPPGQAGVARCGWVGRNSTSCPG